MMNAYIITHHAFADTRFPSKKKVMDARKLAYCVKKMLADILFASEKVRSPGVLRTHYSLISPHCYRRTGSGMRHFFADRHCLNYVDVKGPALNVILHILLSGKIEMFHITMSLGMGPISASYKLTYFKTEKVALFNKRKERRGRPPSVIRFKVLLPLV